MENCKNQNQNRNQNQNQQQETNKQNKQNKQNTYLKGWPQHPLRPTFYYLKRAQLFLSRRFLSAPRRVFFAAYTPPQKTDFILFAPCAARTL